MPRPIEEQFEPNKAAHIQDLAERFRSVPAGAGGVRYFCLELARSLEAGALLAALQVASSLLELSARQLLVFHLADGSNAGTADEPESARPIDVLEYEIEDDRRLRMPQIIDELAEHGVIGEMEKRRIEDFYSDVRIPIHHAITRRFVRNESGSVSLGDEPSSTLSASQLMRMSELEQTIEDNSLDYVEIVAGFVLRHFGPVLDE